MIKRNDINIGDRIVENDPEDTVSEPYTGEVKEIHETGKGDFDYYVRVKLDEASLCSRRISAIDEDGYMTAFGFHINYQKKESENSQIEAVVN